MRQWTVDAFASAPFKGNPACVLEPFTAWPEDTWMQALAAENNQAETAYLLRTEDPTRFGLRWFTPGVEVPLCGHATLASAHVLWTELGLYAEALSFETRWKGVLTVRRAGDGYAMDLPADPPRRLPEVHGLAEALGGVGVKEVWGAAYLVAIVENAAAVRAAKPDGPALNRLSMAANGGRGDVIVAAAGDGTAHDVVSRFFAPGAGVAEDPTTGSAHAILGPLFAEKTGRTTLRCFQDYPGRGGELTAEMRGDRVVLTGAAVTVVESRLRL